MKVHCKYCNDSSAIAFKDSADIVTLECGHSVIHHTPKFESSDGRSPYPFQNDGIDFAESSGYRCLIADEMGLGKTIQALGCLKRANGDLTPCLILVKSSLKIQWFMEVVRWIGVSNLPMIIDNGKTPPVPGFKVYIASYDILRRFTTEEKVEEETKYGTTRVRRIKKNPFYDFPWKCVIMDECQSIKNLSSSRSQEVRKICSNVPHVIGLSGTPIKNRASEFYPILNILRPDEFFSFDRFVRNWLSWDRMRLWNPTRFHNFTKDFIIRRERAEVMPELPAINRVFHHVDFDNEKLRKEYMAAEKQFLRDYAEGLKKKNPINVLAQMSVMRHLVGVNKINPTVDKATEFLLDTNRKLVIFVHHKFVMDSLKLILANWCVDGGFGEPLVLSSDLSAEDRHEVVRRFREDDSSRILIASSLAAGEGLNLQFCSDCIIAERQWNPANEEQLEGRFIRIGQESSQVNAIYMVATKTIDEYLTKLIEKKRALFVESMKGDSVDWREGELMQELVKALQKERENKS